MNFNDYTEIIPGVISSVFGFLVCVTVLIFPELRNLRYVELVLYVTINDLFASTGIALGPTQNGSFGCWYQGITTNFNYLAAIFWTVIITYQVWLVVFKGIIIKDLTYAHAICWGIPLIVTLLPLSTSTYANPDDEADWCFVAETSYSPNWSQLFWFIAAFYGWIWLAMIANVAFIASIVYRFYRMQIVPNQVRSTVRKLLLYPIIITICWSLSACNDMYTTLHPEPNSAKWNVFRGVANILSIAQGFLFAVVFFSMNPLVRDCWYDLYITTLYGAATSPNQDGNVSDTSSRGDGDAQLSPAVGGGTTPHNKISESAAGIHASQNTSRLQDEVDFIPTAGGGGAGGDTLSLWSYISSFSDSISTGTGTSNAFLLW